MQLGTKKLYLRSLTCSVVEAWETKWLHCTIINTWALYFEQIKLCQLLAPHRIVSRGIMLYYCSSEKQTVGKIENWEQWGVIFRLPALNHSEPESDKAYGI